MEWWNDYVGIPYKLSGRDREGLDCWGLVRLIHAEQFNNDLPSFGGYESTDNKLLEVEYKKLQEKVAEQRERWINVDQPKLGDVILFRVLGAPLHIGLYLGDKQFIHAKEGINSAIERIDSIFWEKRITGFYRYDPDAAVSIGAPHPLKTVKINKSIKSGMNVSEFIDEVIEEHKVPKELVKTHIVYIDGELVPNDKWELTTIESGQRIEYRAVPAFDSIGDLLRLVVIVAALAFAAPIAATLGITGAIGVGLVKAGLMIAGTLLVNAIFPVRAPELNSGAIDTPKSQLILQGGANQQNPFGSIPVVLGRFRYTPPLAAENYSDIQASDAYLRMIVCWGYGPLAVSDLRLGDTPLTSYQEVEYETLGDYSGDSGDEITRFNTLYGRDVSQDIINAELDGSDQSPASPWTTQVITGQSTTIIVSIHFPEGMRGLQLDGEGAGNTVQATFRGVIEYRQLDPDTLAPLTSWGNINETSIQTVHQLGEAYFNIDNDQAEEKVYRWTRFTLDEDSKIKRYDGCFTESQSADPSGALLTKLQQQTFGFNTTYTRLPNIGEGEEELWRVCVYGSDIVATTDVRSANITGGGISTSGLKVTIASATITRASTDTVAIGADGESYYKRKDAFTLNRTFNVALGKYEVRVKRTDDSEPDYTSGSGVKFRRSSKAILYSITGLANTRPVVAPKNVSLCMTAMRIRATDQLNGNIEGLVGTVQSVCKDYDYTTDTWIVRPTRNPASLFRYVLQHPANAQKVADSKINLDDLVTWHNYCRNNSFMFDMVILDKRSLLDVLRDICAAGRSSPTFRDGKWSIITDKTRSTVVQFFTPHNSWGFESNKAIPRLPHAFRVSFNNAEKSYQPDEYIVYNDGYSISNATLFEALALPGVTTKDQIYKHARFHFAQLKLRPETYTLNVDFEHLICTRGDLVRVTHDVPMWGLGSGRIKERVTSTQLELYEPVGMDAGVQYTIRIRLEDGSSITRTVSSKVADGYYTTIDLTSSVTTTEAANGNLFMFGSLSEESVRLIVQAIEPMDNLTAKLTLVDYSPDVYNSDDEVIPAFDSQITKPPYLQQTVVTQTPIIISQLSDETMMVVLSQGNFEYRLKTTFANPTNLPKTLKYVRAQLDFANDKIANWSQNVIVSSDQKYVVFGDVEEGSSYYVRMRYETEDGRFGPWVTSSAHTIVGKTTPPKAVTGLTATVEGQMIRLDWDDNKEPDFSYYEVRLTNSNWGYGDRLYTGKTSTCLVDPPGGGSSLTWYIKAVDVAKNYSTTSSSVSYTTAAPANITDITFTFTDTALTTATVTLDWSDITPVFGLNYYEVSYGAVVKTVKASTITLPADWIGSRTYTVKVVDLLGNKSSGYSEAVTKLAPDSPTSFRAQVIDNNIMFYWNLPAKTTLPIDHVLLKKGASWATATEIGPKSGGFTTVNEQVGGTYTYWIAAVDTDNNESTPVSLTAIVAEPPDFIFHGDFTSTLSGTKSSAISESNYVLAPVNTTETWASHFTSRSWSTPSNQVTAGYPIFIQPANGTGYYEETFDFGSILSSSKVTLTYDGTLVSGSVTITPKISISANGSTYTDYDGSDSIYGTNFRYVKVRLTFTETTGTGLYALDYLYVKLDAKLKNDAGQVSAVSTDTNGTIVNFAIEYVDVTSITLSPSGTTAAIPVYDFTDSNLSATYSVTSNVCTVTYTAHGFITGQNVRIQTSTGGGIDGVYAITGYTANTFTVNMTTANTSGNCLVYPESFRVYLFNTSGTRISGTVSWNVKGY